MASPFSDNKALNYQLISPLINLEQSPDVDVQDRISSDSQISLFSELSLLLKIILDKSIVIGNLCIMM